MFTVVNWKLVPGPEIMQVAALRAILDADRTRDKREAEADLLYIYGMMQPGGPFIDLPVLSRDKSVRKNTYGAVDEGPYETSHPVRWARIIAGMHAYRDHNENAEQRLMLELDYSLDFVTDSLRSIRQSNTTDPKVVKQTVMLMGEVKALLTNKKETEKLLAVGLEASKSKSKAGAEPSPLEKGALFAVLGSKKAQ